MICYYRYSFINLIISVFIIISFIYLPIATNLHFITVFRFHYLQLIQLLIKYLYLFRKFAKIIQTLIFEGPGLLILFLNFQNLLNL